MPSSAFIFPINNSVPHMPILAETLLSYASGHDSGDVVQTSWGVGGRQTLAGRIPPFSISSRELKLVPPLPTPSGVAVDHGAHTAEQMVFMCCHRTALRCSPPHRDAL